MPLVKEAKKVDKEFIQEEKQDEKHVKAIEKDLKKAEEKESGLAKGTSKAEKMKLNDAIHAHENASIALQRSKEEVQSKQAALGDASRKVEKEQSLLEEALRIKSTHIVRGIASAQEPSSVHGGGVQPQQTQSHVTSPLDNRGQDTGQSSKVPGACQDSPMGSSEGAH
ncbi:hypothetical protein BS47DRAFT_1355104, partial [Hydnum rufescens UP504]